MSDQNDEQLLEHAQAVLQQGRPALSPEARARMARNVSAGTAKAKSGMFSWWGPWALAAAGTATIAYLAIVTATPKDSAINSNETALSEPSPDTSSRPDQELTKNRIHRSLDLEQRPFVRTNPAIEVETHAADPREIAEKKRSLKPVAAKIEQPESSASAMIIPEPEAPDRDPEMQAADRLRLSGQLARAASAYEAVAQDPDAASYAEEALYRAARLHQELGNLARTRTLLLSARTRFPAGPLAPERAAFEASLPK